MSQNAEFDAIIANILEGDDAAELAATAELGEEIAKAPKLKDNGLAYVGDVDDFSAYVVRVGGCTLFTVLVDATDKEYAPVGAKGKTRHAVRIQSVDGETTIETNGRIRRKTGSNGERHIDSADVRRYVLPRAARFMNELYGA
jgi:hypothetical protein